MLGNSLAFQQLGLSVSTAGLRFQFPVRKLRSLKPDCTTKKKKKERKKNHMLGLLRFKIRINLPVKL